MKTILLTLFILLLYTYTAYAQADSYTIKPGEDVNATLPASIKFLYPQFTSGGVFFRDGTTSHALMDYNLLTSEMQFIAPNGDTLAVANEVTIKYIAIGSDTFFYDKNYLQLVAGNATAKLAKRETLAMGDVKKAGGYGQVSSTSAITTVSSVRLQNRVTNLTEDKELVINKQTAYYIGDTYNHFLPANKKNIIKLFGKKQAAVEQYCKDNKIAFNKEADLKAIIVFLKD
ncbi:hypothetical protein FC093_08140 [Ilyomonas limi]|uniref:FecR protein domain-containing protein n=1 Tax=Ilyomonas limi TaxID=2575867 RepID=A0A4U3L4L8_9BACT|nr:hypothetical protein [Ilyomonas limi]TKK69279.1 hypothetical protein FC093_08140 [Ilyomonas limi]